MIRALIYGLTILYLGPGLAFAVLAAASLVLAWRQSSTRAAGTTPP